MSGPGDPRPDTTQVPAAAASVAGTTDEDDRRSLSPLERIQHTLHKYPALGPFIVLVVLVTAFSLVVPDRFLKASNLSLVIGQVTVVGTLAIGQTIIILTAGVDLSVGAIAVFASIVMANLNAVVGLPGPLALLLGFVLGTGCGLMNGWLITRFRMHPFLAQHFYTMLSGLCF